MKQIIKNTPLYPLLKGIMQQIRKIKFVFSQPYSFQHDGATTNFVTNDPYSYGWFYPRYSNGKIHEPQATRIFIEELSQSKVVVDVGANLGWFTCIAGSQNRSAEIFSFELDSANYKICNRVFLLGIGIFALSEAQNLSIFQGNDDSSVSIHSQAPANGRAG